MTATTTGTGGGGVGDVGGVAGVVGGGLVGWQRRRSSVSSKTATRALPETLFSIGTVAVLPLYGMMIGAPQAAVSKRTMSSVFPFALMGSLYGVAACLILQSAGAHGVFSTFIASTSTSGSLASFAAHTLTLLSG